MNTICNHDVMEQSKTIGKLMAKCEECGRRKKWPWAKIMKCCRTYDNNIPIQ